MRLLTCLFLMLAWAGAAAQPVQTVAPGVLLLPGSYPAQRQPDGNSLLLQGQGGWLLIDTGRHAAHTQAALDAAGGRVLAVINTHWHLDHLGGNAQLRGQLPGLSVWASPSVLQALSPDGWLDRYRRQLVQALPTATPDAAAVMRVDLALLEQAALLTPDHPVTVAGPVRLAGRPLHLGLETSVSGGDLWVLDPASGTLAAGDLVTLPVPFFDTACLPAWREALARLAAQPFERLVPGHGPVMTREDFGRWRAGFEALLACSAQGLHPSACAAIWRRHASPWLDAADEARVVPMLGYYAKTLLQAPPAQRDRFCRRS